LEKAKIRNYPAIDSGAFHYGKGPLGVPKLAPSTHVRSGMWCKHDKDVSRVTVCSHCRTICWSPSAGAPARRLCL